MTRQTGCLPTIIPDNSAIGLVQMSDANGNVSWQPLTTTTDIAPTGLTGATQASRYVGATTSGAPVSGTFALGDFVIDQTGVIWICTTAGSPGSWTNAGAGGAIIAPAGDIGGTSSAPVIAKINGSAATGEYARGNGTALAMSAIQAADLPAATTSAQGAVILDGTAGDIVALGSQAAGNSTKAAAANHVHPTTGLVTGVAATDTSIVIGGTSAAPTVATGTLDVIATQHPPAGNWSNNSHKITSLAAGAAATDAVNFSQYAQTPVQYAKYSGVTGTNTPRETIPFYTASGTNTPTSGVMQLTLCPVVPGDVITNVGFVTSGTGVTFGSSGYHWWTALYSVASSTTATFVAQSADQTNTAIGTQAAFMLALGTGAPYTVPSNVYSVYLAVMVNYGTGGSPVMATFRGLTLNNAMCDNSTTLFPTASIYCGTNGSSLGATAPSGTITVAGDANIYYMGLS